MPKETKSFLPKTIGGVKVPKKVRKGPLGELLASPDGPRLLAEAIAASTPAGGSPGPVAEPAWPELPAVDDSPAFPAG